MGTARSLPRLLNYHDRSVLSPCSIRTQYHLSHFFLCGLVVAQSAQRIYRGILSELLILLSGGRPATPRRGCCPTSLVQRILWPSSRRLLRASLGFTNFPAVARSGGMGGINPRVSWGYYEDIKRRRGGKGDEGRRGEVSIDFNN